MKLDLGATGYWLGNVSVLRTKITENQVVQILLAALVFIGVISLFWRLM